MKKKILLTIWLALPITIVSLLMVWIFVSLDKEKLMADAPAVGAGANDTGNANAFGEWLAGNDADAISLATRAKREGVAVDPRVWPGGVIIRLPESAFDGPREEWGLMVVGRVSGLFDQVQLKTSRDAQGFMDATFDAGRLYDADVFAIDRSPMIKDDEVLDPLGRGFKSLEIPLQIPGEDQVVKDPMVVVLRMDSVYLESP